MRLSKPSKKTRRRLPKGYARAVGKTSARVEGRAGDKRSNRSCQDLELQNQDLEMQKRSLIKSQLELELSRERYADLYDAVPVCFAIFTRAGLIKEVNLPAIQLLGRRRDQLIGLPFANFVARSDQKKFLGHLHRCRQNLEHNMPLSVEVELAASPGKKPLFIELISTPSGGSHMGPAIYKCIFFDISDRKRQEAELKRAHEEIERASRAKDDFLAVLSHELRAPLNPVLLIASDAVRDLDLPPRMRANFDIIRRNIELEARLIDDLLDLTRIARGKLVLETKPVRGHEILHDAVSMLRSEFEQKQLVLKEKLAAANDLILGDAVRLQQVFYNILKNAVKFTPAKGSVSIETGITKEKEFFVAISDTGMGMTAHEIARVFEAFAQGDHAARGGSHHFGGLGIGLAICHKLVELHSGSIEAASLGHDQGSTFTARFPIVLSGKPVSTVPSEHGYEQAILPLPVMSILLVEDHEPTRNALAALLVRRNHKVQTAASVKEAQAAAHAHAFDLLISDIGLPDGNGYDLMHELQAEQHLEGIALTGYGMEEDIKHSLAAGFVAHLTKPVSIDSLEQALAAVKTKKVPTGTCRVPGHGEMQRG